MDLVEATARAMRMVEEAMKRPRPNSRWNPSPKDGGCAYCEREPCVCDDRRRCEICDDALGVMTEAAYIAAHRHCDLCARECEECREEARA